MAATRGLGDSLRLAPPGLARPTAADDDIDQAGHDEIEFIPRGQVAHAVRQLRRNTD